MITIKLKYNSSTEYQEFLKTLRKQYTSVYHYSYNRLFDGLSKKEIYHLVSKLNNVELIKGRLIIDCVDLANNLYEKNKKSKYKSIFGSRKNFIQRCKNKITKEQLTDLKLVSLYLQGETNYKGSRYFNLDILNNKIIYKYDKNSHFDLNIKLSKNQQKQLIELENLCVLKKSKYTVTLNEIYICLSFEPAKHEILNLSNTRYIGIDLNPTNIGISICEMNKELKIIDTYNYDFSEIVNKTIKTKTTSDSKISNHLNNKLNYEILDISKRISDISKHYKCKFIFIEDLNFKNENKSKSFNRLTRNIWKKNIFIQNLEKRCCINGQYLYKMNPAYTTFIGNSMYNYSDPVNASIEIGRRGFEFFINRTKKFYPNFMLKESLIHRWKEMVSDSHESWKELYVLVKNSKQSYRVSLEDVESFNVFRKKSRMYNIYRFC